MPLTGRLWAAATTLAAPALRIMLRRRLAHGKEDAARLAERYGTETQPRPAGRLLWLHAASVGECMSALPLLQALPAELTILFTTGTRTSAALLASRLPVMNLACTVLHRYVPLDVPAWAARFLDHWRPDTACFLESELWPNLLAGCRRRGIPAALVNARMSPRSARGWALVPGLARDMLGGFALVAARSEQDAARLRALGATNVVTWGDLKSVADVLPVDPGAFDALAARLGRAPRWLAASTHPADEPAVIAAHRALAMRHPGLITAIVPRHPERGAALAASLGAPRRSEGAFPPPEGGIWVADTLGELGLMYSCFPTVFMGKSFPPGGGQNPWEPARLGCAIATGPAMGNFEDAVSVLLQAGALHQVTDADALAGWLDAMLTDPAARDRMGRAARAATRPGGDLIPRLAGRLLRLTGSD